MTNQSGGARPAQGKAPSGGHPSRTGRYTATMWIGGLVGLLGFYLVLGSYSSEPTKFYFGLTLLVVGGLAGLISAIIRSIVRNRGQQRP